MRKIKELWRDFWFKPKYNDSSNICYGEYYNTKYEFRTQRLINIILFILFIVFNILWISSLIIMVK